MYNVEIGLERDETITTKLCGGSMFVWNDGGEIKVSIDSVERNLLHSGRGRQTEIQGAVE